MKSELQRIKARTINRYGESKVREDGIFLTCRFRGENDARTFAELVRSSHPEAYVAECRKTRKAQFTGDLTWLVTFTITTDADRYLQGFIAYNRIND